MAARLAESSQSLVARTTAEIAEVEEHLRLLKAQRDGQLNAGGRLATYQPNIGPGDYQWPKCWIVDGQSSRLNPIPFEKPDEDILRCRTCGRDFGVSLR